MWLPPDEYSALDSAIRSRYANKIPKNDAILYRNHFYRYTYNVVTDEILCTDRIIIEGNQRIISAAMKKKGGRETC